MNAVVLLAIALNVPTEVVNLDHPGAMEALKAANPDRHRRVEGVIQAAYSMNCGVPEFERFLRTKYEATRPICGPIVKTSYPPQRVLHFQIGDTSYSKTVYFEVKRPETPGRVVPVK